MSTSSCWYQLGITTLDEEVFKPLGAKLHLDAHIGLLQLTTKNDNIVTSSELAKALGFSQNTFEGAKMLLRNGLTTSGGRYTADEPHRLAVNREVYIHLAELSTSENLTNGQPSTLHRSIPDENEKRGAGRTISFQVLQYKRLAVGPISQLTISLRDNKGEEVTIRVHQRDVAYQKWLTRVALGASENALGWLWLTLVTLKGSIEAERKTSFTLSSRLKGSTKKVHPL